MEAPSTSERLFFALWPPRRTALALGAWARSIERATGGRPTRAETIHLTLAFLGTVDAPRREAAIAAAATVRGAPHRLPIETAEYWPHNRIVWAGPLRAPGALLRVATGLREALEDAGFVLARRPFAAHVTLLRKARGGAELAAPPRVDWPVDAFVLVRSQRSGAGPAYETVARFPLDERA